MSWSRRLAGKYGAKKSEYAGQSFASGLERAVYQQLELREKAGEISDLRCQVQVHLSEAAILLKPDFAFIDVATGEQHYAEAKGFETPQWRIKLKLWRVYGPGPLEIWKGTARQPVLDEVVKPSKKGE